jgi:hypothetical protein
LASPLWYISANCMHCCAEMNWRLPQKEAAVVYIARYREYGTLLNNGSAYMVLEFCPWCGTRFPETLRSQWMSAVLQYGCRPDSEHIPGKFLTDEWWNQPAARQAPQPAAPSGTSAKSA